MADQFEEWDRFYAAYQSSKTAPGGFQRYKEQRKKRRYAAAGKKAAATRARKRETASSG